MWTVIAESRPIYYVNSHAGEALGTWIGLLVLVLHWT